MSSARATTAAAAQRVNASAAFHPHDAARPALQVPTFQFGAALHQHVAAQPALQVPTFQFGASSARAKKAAAAQRVNASAAFHPHHAAQPALQVPTFQFGLPPRFKGPNPDHPASDQLFATVAALQHLCNEHDMDHVSPPPIWPMILHGAMPDPFGGDDEDRADDENRAVTRCLCAIAHGNDVMIRLAIRGAVRILEAMCQRQCYLPFLPEACVAARVCMRALAIDGDSVDVLCRSKIRLIGLLCWTVQGLQLGECCAPLITKVGRERDKRMHDTCMMAIFYVYWSLADAGSDMPLLDELHGLLSDKPHSVVDPAVAGLLLLLANKPGFAELLRCSVDQLLQRDSAQAPVELWFAAALLAPEHKSHGHELGLSCIPFQTALHCLDGPPEVAEPAVAVFGGLARLGWGEHAALQDDVLKRMPRLLTQGDAALCVEALSCLRENMVAHDVTFFVEALLPVLMELTDAPITSAVPSLTRCPDPFRSRHLLATTDGGNARFIPTAAATIIADACVAHAEALVPALLEAPRLATFFHNLHEGTTTAQGTRLAEALMHILSRLLADEGYERVVRAVGLDTWHEFVDNYSVLPAWRSTVLCQWKAAIGMAIVEHEDVERCLHTLDGLRHCLTVRFTQGFGSWHPDLYEALSLRHAAKILECCASTDSRTAEGWTILLALASAGEGDDEKTASIVNLIHAQQHVLSAALQHPSTNVRLAALRCASKVVAAASFPRTDRLAMMDVLVRCLRDMREEAQAAAGTRPREGDYSDEFEAVATLWRFDEGEDRWTGGAKGTVKVLAHRLLADNSLFIFRDANGKLMAYHPSTADTQLVKVDDVTWEWRAEKDYADDDEGFAEQFRLSLQSSERASRFQHYITRSNCQNKGLADAAFSGPSPVTVWTAVQHISVVDDAEVRNPFRAASPQHPFGRVSSAQASTNPLVTTVPQPAAPGSSPTPGSNRFAAYKSAEAATGGFFSSRSPPAPGTSALPLPPGMAVEDEFVAAAEKAFGSYSVARLQTFVDAVLRAAIHGPAKNITRPTSDDRSRFDEEYRLAALTALRTWCESDVTSEPVACCPAAQRLVDNGGAMEIALVAIACYDPISHAVSNGWARFGVGDTLLFHSSKVGYCVMTTLQKHVRPGTMREALGEDLYTAAAALVTVYRLNGINCLA
jgi:Ran-binding protein 1